MEISYIGHSSFLLKTKDCRVVTDPFGPSTGMVFPKTMADIITLSHNHDDHNYVAGVQGEPMVFDWPGEFEKKGVRIFGFQSFHDTKQGEERGENTIYKFEIDGLTILHAGDLGHLPDDKLIEAIGEIDILIIPVGGTYSLDAKQAVDTAKKLDPSIVIPMHFGTEKLNTELGAQLAPVTEFLKLMGAEAVQPIEKYVVKKEDISEKELEVVVLSS